MLGCLKARAKDYSPSMVWTVQTSSPRRSRGCFAVSCALKLCREYMGRRIQPSQSVGAHADARRLANVLKNRAALVAKVLAGEDTGVTTFDLDSMRKHLDTCWQKHARADSNCSPRARSQRSTKRLPRGGVESMGAGSRLGCDAQRCEVNQEQPHPARRSTRREWVSL